MKESAWDRISRVNREAALVRHAGETAAAQQVNSERQRFIGMLAILKDSSIPRAEIEILKNTSGLGRLGKQTFTISEYTTGRNNTATMQYGLYVAETRVGWYMPNVFPEPPPDPDRKYAVPRSLVLSEDSTTWTTMWEAYGGDGNIVGVPYDDSILSAGRSRTFYPVDAIARFIDRSHE